jgi:acyl-CoA synthetase (NDP forming)
VSELGRLLEPRSIAIVGLSSDPTKHGQRVLANLRKVGFAGSIWGVHPRGDALAGVDVFRSLRDGPRSPDVVVSAVPAVVVPDVARDAASVDAGALIVFAGGFAESDSDGDLLQAELRSIAVSTKLRILGPNSGGVIVPGTGVAMSFLTCLDRPADQIRSGSVGLVTQSGGTGSYVHNLAAGHGGGLAASVSTGNEVDIDVADGIVALANMEAVRTIGVVLEAVRNGQRFVDAVHHAHARGKRVVVSRIGTSDVGQRLMESHTGALASPTRVLEGVLDALGVPVVATPGEMLEVAEVLARTPQPPGPRLGVVTHSGGMAILLSDLAANTSIQLPAPSENLSQAIAPFLQQGSCANPLDLGGIIGGPKRFGEAVVTFAGSGEFDMVLAVSSAHPPAHSVERAEGLADLTTPVPVVHLWMAGDVGLGGFDVLKAADLPIAEEPRAAIAALDALAVEPQLSPDAPADAGFEHLESSIAAGARFSEHDSKELLRSWGFPVVEGIIAQSGSLAVAAADHLGYPVAVKVNSPDIAHKTEIGGVRVGVVDGAAAWDAYESVVAAARSKAPGAEVNGALIERMATGIEMIVGVVSDPTFGPMLLVGIGGMAAEAFDDVQMSPAPSSPERVRAMVQSLRGERLLTEPRVGEPADLDALAQFASRFSARVVAEDQIESFELNPIVWTGTTWLALDAAIAVLPTS